MLTAGCRPAENGAGGSLAEQPKREAAATVTGIVCDQLGPLAGARVRFQGQPTHVVTDANGHFALPRLPSIKPLTITAAKAGYVIGSTRADQKPLRLQLEPLPSHDHAEYEWVDPTPDPSAHGNCGNCHQQIYEQWESTGHATAATNRRLHNLYDGTDWHGVPGRGWNLLQDYPAGAGVCVACHAPAARLDELGIGDLRQVDGVARQGVHCDFCHKVQEVDLQAVGLTHGRFGMQLLRPAEGQLFFGPLDDVDRGEDAFSPLQQESRFCAPCHEGVLFGVPVYTTYSEWLASPARAAGLQCQSCHMKPDGQMTNIAAGHGGIERHPMTLGSHELLPGGREAMLRRCVQLEVSSVTGDEGVDVTVQLRAQGVGHHVPTGFIDRHLILQLEARGGQGQTLAPLDGPVLPAFVGADRQGRPGILLAKYLQVADQQAPLPFWDPQGELTDTRLVPGEPRKVTFRFAQGVEEVSVQLVYRHFWKQVAETKQWPDQEILVHQIEHVVSGPSRE